VTGFIRIGAVGLAALTVWTVAGSGVASGQRLPLDAIVPGAVETLPFGCTSFEMEPFDPFCFGQHIHTGVDLAAPEGRAVRAAAIGTAYVGFDPARAGIYVYEVIDEHVRVLYCHLSRVRVSYGQRVAAGDVIGEVGSTGLSTGAHLHFEVQVDGRAIDPAVWLAS
jgi:murein DD-endopeptidase MepM/ murein hydrolase activator NlpD